MQITDGKLGDQLPSAIVRSSVGIDDDRPLAGKTAEDAVSNRSHDRSDTLRVVMSGQADKNVGLANFDKLAEKIVGKKVPIFHFKIPY
jgi:hypothetical protein